MVESGSLKLDNIEVAGRRRQRALEQKREERVSERKGKIVLRTEVRGGTTCYTRGTTR